MIDNINAVAFEKEMQQGSNHVLLDVRTPEEHSEVRIPNSINIDINGPAFHDQIEKLDKNKHYLIYCRSGMRSYNACVIMYNNGFENVTNLMGGIIGWHGDTERG